MAQETSEQAAVREITPQEAFDELKSSDAILVDTREPHSTRRPIDGANLVPPAMLSEKIANVAPDKSGRVILSCRSGARSYKAAEQMMAMGYEDVASVAGGILEWQGSRPPGDREQQPHP